MIKIAMLSKWHVHADGYARDIQANNNLSIELVWDEDPSRGIEWSEKLGVSFESNLQTVLANPNIDAIVINTPTSMHKDIILKAAQYKKHVFTEKILAFSTKDCDEIYEAIQASGIQLMVSLPRLTDQNFSYANAAIKEGWLGKLTMIRCRLAHNGSVIPEGKTSGWLPERFYNKEQAGGGAMMDLGAHPIYLTNRLAGKAKTVYARLNQEENNKVDDNSALMVEYESGTLGIIESSFLSHGSPFQLELYGTEGTLLISNDQVQIKSEHINNEELRDLSNSLIPLQDPLLQWVDAIKTGSIPTITKEDIINLTLINEAAFKSHDEKRLINIKDM